MHGQSKSHSWHYAWEYRSRLTGCCETVSWVVGSVFKIVFAAVQLAVTLGVQVQVDQVLHEGRWRQCRCGGTALLEYSCEAQVYQVLWEVSDEGRVSVAPKR